MNQHLKNFLSDPIHYPISAASWSIAFSMLVIFYVISVRTHSIFNGVISAFAVFVIYIVLKYFIYSNNQLYSNFALTLLFGWSGYYQFSKGKKIIGLVYIFTFGLFGICWLIDIISAFGDILSIPPSSYDGQASYSAYAQPYTKPETPPDNFYTSFSRELERIPIPDLHSTESSIKGIPFSEVTVSNITLKNSFEKLKTFCVVDTETTGLSCVQNELIEIAAIKFIDFEPVEKISYLIKPKKPIPYSATKINGITNEMVYSAPPVEQVMPLINEFTKGYNIIGHNIEFDLKFLIGSGFKITKKQKCFDTLRLARRIIKKGDILNYKLVTLCDFFNICRTDAHRALSDSYATALIYKHLLCLLFEDYV